MAKAKAAANCRACGVTLRELSERCPLCGGDPKRPASARAPNEDIESYQARLRRLRRELDALRREQAV